jgi:hypothetical protein
MVSPVYSHPVMPSPALQCDGKPVIYSVGVDRTDDGGKRLAGNGLYAHDTAAMWTKPQVMPLGDWVLYPADADEN